jgi:hypothetical protein
MGPESMASAAKLGTHFLVIVDFTIEGDGCIAILGSHGLVS